MAAASEPPHITALLNCLRPICDGLSLCGAGAGGFAVLLLQKDVSYDAAKEFVEIHSQAVITDAGLSNKLSCHRVTICEDGTTSRHRTFESHRNLLEYLL